MNIKLLVAAVVSLLAVIVLSASVYVVSEKERAVVLRFGALVNDNVSPGIHIKFPLADTVKRFDARVLTVDATPESFFTVQQKRVEVDSFAKWRITDVGRYYRSTGGDERLASVRLASRINDGLRNEFGRRTLHEVVSGERDQLMADLANSLNETVSETLGIEVVDVRVKRIDLPQEVGRSVYQRMAAERKEEATEYRSKGREEGEKIQANADRLRTIIAAEAYRDAELLRGEGDALASSTYAEAYNKDPEFYAFTRSLKAYRSSFAGKQDMMLVSPDSEFFKYLKDANGSK